LYLDGTFYLYYHGVDADNIRRIGLATGTDPTNLTKRGIVLNATPAILNEDPAVGGYGVDAPKVFYIEELDPPWRMIFTGFGKYGAWNGIAYSEDGLVWEKKISPLLLAEGRMRAGVTGNLANVATIRNIGRVGTVWIGFGMEYKQIVDDIYLVGQGGFNPAVSIDLERWWKFGNKAFYANQDYEQGDIYLYDAEFEGEWVYIYYSYLIGAGVYRLGLVRAPRRSTRQPMVLWSGKTVVAAGEETMIIDPDPGKTISFYLISDQAGTMYIRAYDPIGDTFRDIDQKPVAANDLTVYNLVNTKVHRVRIFFDPDAEATVSCWAVQE